MSNNFRNFLIITSLLSTVILSGQVRAQVFPRGTGSWRPLALTN